MYNAIFLWYPPGSSHLHKMAAFQNWKLSPGSSEAGGGGRPVCHCRPWRAPRWFLCRSRHPQGADFLWAWSQTPTGIPRRQGAHGAPSLGHGQGVKWPLGVGGPTQENNWYEQMSAVSPRFNAISIILHNFIPSSVRMNWRKWKT